MVASQRCWKAGRCYQIGNESPGIHGLFAIRLKSLKPKEKGYPAELNTVGDHIRKVRMDRGLFQREVAGQICVSPCALRNWEKNHTQPRTGHMPGVITFLGYCPHRPTKTFAEWLEQARTAQGLGQRDLASAVGIDATTIWKWEVGRHEPIGSMGTRVVCFLAPGRDG